MQKEMEVRAVQVQKEAEISKKAAEIQAEQEKIVTITIEQANLEQSKIKSQSIEVEANAFLKKTTMEAEGIQKTGEANAAAEKALQLAPVEAQIVLAKEIS